MNKLKYIGCTIVFQEVPDEVTLAVNISGCPHRCEGCHSEYLWEYKGRYLSDDIAHLIQMYKDLITCVCFMGGEQNPEDLVKCLLIAKSQNLKTCVYSGCDDIKVLSQNGIAQYCDYIKIGHYDKKLGGLSSSSTNQRFYALSSDEFIDKTSLFRKGVRPSLA